MDTSPAPDDQRIIEALLPAVIDAGRAILAIRKRGHAIDTKADNSPVTEADHAAEGIILEALARLCPEIPVLAEEEVAAGRIPRTEGAFFAVDALDGTKDFIRGGPDFTVNVGLIRGDRPVAGIVGAPALNRAWIGVAGVGAWSIDEDAGERTRIGVREASADAIDIVASRSHRTPETDDFIARFPGANIVAAGSSLKLVAVAEGNADLYPRLAPTSQWDTAAGDAVLTAAGGRVLELDGQVMRYGPRDEGGPHPFLNPWFVATGGMDPFAAAPK